MTSNSSNTCGPHSFSSLPFTQPSICPSASARRQLTRNCLVKQKKTSGRLTRPTDTVDENLKICGIKLRVAAAASRIFYVRPTAFDSELRELACTGHCDSADKFDRNSATHPSLLAANDRHCCDDESFGDRCDADARLSVNDNQSMCQPSDRCRASQEKAGFFSEQGETNECLDTGGAEAEISHNCEGTYRNVRIDQNRKLKVLRKFDTIRQRARAVKDGCLLRFETRQKQRLRLLDLSEFEHQKKNDRQRSLGNDKPLPLDKSATAATLKLNDIRIEGRTADVKMRDVIDLCDRTRSAKFQTTWPPALDDSPINFEPTNAVISSLMSQFEQIRLNSATARLDDQKCFDNKRRQRKYYK